MSPTRASAQDCFGNLARSDCIQCDHQCMQPCLAKKGRSVLQGVRLPRLMLFNLRHTLANVFALAPCYGQPICQMCDFVAWQVMLLIFMSSIPSHPGPRTRYPTMLASLHVSVAVAGKKHLLVCTLITQSTAFMRTAI